MNCDHCTSANCTFPACQHKRKVRLDQYEQRAYMLIDTFSNSRGEGSVLTTCPQEQCTWPKCLHVTNSVEN